jgi:hypothetical protein
MRVLVACEFSGTVRDAFTARGHYARSCDLLPTEAMQPVVFAGDLPLCDCCGEEPWCPIHEEHYADCTCVGPTEDEAEYSFEEGADPVGARHHSGDLFSIDLEREGYDLLIAHPPCTRLTVAGARWFKGREQEQAEAIAFVERIWSLPVPMIAIENPIGVLSTRSSLGKPTQIIQPWQFGHGETKATCLWLKNLPPLQPTNIVSGREARIHKLPPSKDRWKIRSLTYHGIADAMADQWSRPRAASAEPPDLFSDLERRLA